MDMLFGLAAGGLLTLEQAARIADMDIFEAEDMLRGWQIAHNG